MIITNVNPHVTYWYITIYDRNMSPIVIIPDYQGIGIGAALIESVAEVHRLEGRRINVTASHPAVIAHCRRSPHWRAVGGRKAGPRSLQRRAAGYGGAEGRAVASFEYVGLRG